ncbi:MAG TPA: class IV adenylate cyclase [Casimicrobiaceae bacterium]|nr:class IV adenylate cyclase [Casimicrobiaceae bacterium]
MPRNVEIKARVASIHALTSRVAAIATAGPDYIDQDDTFFRCSNGRLKLRVFSGGGGELIFYRRADNAGPRESFYLCSPTVSADTLRDSLSIAYGQAGRLKKRRTVFFVDRTRVHLDNVEGLGEFVEIEVVLEEDEQVERGIAEANSLLATLGISSSQLIAGAYVDLLHARA